MTTRSSPLDAAPSKRISPLVGGRSPSIMRASVDLPQPDSPTSPRISPLRTVSETPLTACNTRRVLEQAAVDHEAPLDIAGFQRGACHTGATSAALAALACGERRQR